MEKLMLSEARPGTTYSVLEIKDEVRLINRLSSMGILCGSHLEICQNNKNNPCWFLYVTPLVAIGREESKKIFIGGSGNE